MTSNETEKALVLVERERSWEPAFLGVLAATGNVSAACRAAGISRQDAYQVRSRHPDFGERWAEALADAADSVEAEAWRRAVEGYDEPVFYHGEPTGHVIRRYSDGLLALLLKGLKPERYGDSLRLEESVGRKARELAELYGLSPEEVTSSARALLRPGKSR